MKTLIHAPMHLFNEKGTYMVTGATFNKELYFKKSEELDLLHDLLLELSEYYQWRVEAWAIFANHYHFIAQSPENPTTLKKFITHLHASSARQLNSWNGFPGRKIWYQYWDSRITYQASYLARLNYVMNNPVKHKIVERASQYKWCSASWFELHASKAYYQTVTSIKSDSITIMDDF
jgi:putative transposase